MSPELNALALRRVGQHVGKWKIETLIGLGGMAAVYAAREAHSARVAIKVLHREHALSARQRRRFRAEARIANLISHRSIVRVQDHGVSWDGAPFLVMEFLHGDSLAELCASYGGRLAPELLLPLMAEALEALAEAHAQGVIHRDLKPANLFASHEGTLKLLDFGVAQAAALFTLTALDTDDLSVLGTPAFMPPEQARGCWDEIDARSDLWALAATMFTLLSGQHVHGRGSSRELLGRAMVMSVRSIADVRPGLSRPLVAFLARALSFAQADRFQDAGSMLAALRSLPEAEQAGSKRFGPWTPAARRPEPTPLAVTDTLANSVSSESLVRASPKLAQRAAGAPLRSPARALLAKLLGR